jgi:hypothetical protein
MIFLDGFAFKAVSNAMEGKGRRAKTRYSHLSPGSNCWQQFWSAMLFIVGGTNKWAGWLYTIQNTGCGWICTLMVGVGNVMVWLLK